MERTFHPLLIALFLFVLEVGPFNFMLKAITIHIFLEGMCNTLHAHLGSQWLLFDELTEFHPLMLHPLPSSQKARTTLVDGRAI